MSAEAGHPSVGSGAVATVAAAVPALAANLALELAPVRVNLIAAGFVDTPLSASLLGSDLEKRRDQLRATLPIRRVVEPDDVAALAVHIMSNTALTGATYKIDGGQQLVSRLAMLAAEPLLDVRVDTRKRTWRLSSIVAEQAGVELLA